MLKQYKKQLIISSVLILLPVLAGLLLWNQLPDTIATHWGPDGQANGWSSKAFSVFGLPLILLVLHWFCVFATSSDPKSENHNKKVVSLVFWICPVVSIFGASAIYCDALGIPYDMGRIPHVLVSAMFIFIGNYLPKCKHNYTIGIKLPWTFASEENWNATHRFAGKLWVVGGLIIGLMVFLPDKFIFPSMMVTMLPLVIIPIVYSYLYARKHG